MLTVMVSFMCPQNDHMTSWYWDDRNSLDDHKMDMKVDYETIARWFSTKEMRWSHEDFKMIIIMWSSDDKYDSKIIIRT